MTTAPPPPGPAGVLVLHAFVARDGTIACWAETDRPTNPTPAPTGAGSGGAGSGGAGSGGAGSGGGGSGGGGVGRLPAIHPFAAGADELARWVPGASPRPAACLLLPTVGRTGPLASPQLGAAARRGRPRWRAWTVPAVTVAPPSPLLDLSLLTSGLLTSDLAPSGLPGSGLPGSGLPGSGLSSSGAAGWEVRAGASLRHLAEVTAFAIDLVDRGRVLPGVLPDGPRPRARWVPLLTGRDAARHADLLRAMPPACRAERSRPGDVGGLPAADALHAALNRLVDALVRDRLAARRVTAPIGAESVDAWLGALVGDGDFDAPSAALRTLTDRVDAWHADAARRPTVRVCFRLTHLDPPEPDEPDATDHATPATAPPAIPSGIPQAAASSTPPAEPAAPSGAAPSPPGASSGTPRAQPADPPDAWLLEFLLQPVDEPGLLVPAADVWRDAAAPLRRWTHHPQEQLLAGLGRAARLHPDLAPALRAARPADMLLDTAGAHRFLSQAAVLEQAGYGILVPARWRRPQQLGLALDVRPTDEVSPVLRDDTVGLGTLVGYRWGLALGGRPLTEAELRDLAAATVPLVRLRGQWVHLDAGRLRAGLDFLARGGGPGTMTAGEALRLVRLRPDVPLPLPVTATGGRGWAADLLAGRVHDTLELLEAPAGLTGRLRPYQRRGLSWLAFLDRLGLGACLADDMGLGKTVQVLALELHARSSGRRPPTLLVCPLSVLGNWQREAARFAPGLRVDVLHGADRPDPALPAGRCDLLLTTYATATRDADALAAVPWDRVVLDEAQHIKNSAGAAARAVRRFPARQRIALTGTPVENRLAELWSIMDFVNPGMLGSAHTFRARYAVPIERYADEGAAARLRHATRPFMLRRVKSDPGVVDDLPDKRHTRHLCTLTVEQAALYQAVLDDVLQRLDEAEDARRNGLVLAAMTKLKQVCNHPAQFLGDNSPLPGRSGKLDRLEDILDRVVADGERALCFTQYARFGAMLAPHLAARLGVPVRYLHGGTTKRARDALVADFQADPRPGVFVLSLKAGGTGLNLTAANHVVHVDRWWNPATEAQATDRAFRIGQHRDVQVHTLLCLGTLEERIDTVIAEKGALAERVVGNGEGWLTRLSTGELRDLLALAPEATGD